MTPTTGWKLLTHDFRPPLQGGDPLFDGRYPHVLPVADLDTSSAECGAGWNFCRTIQQGFSIAGLWRTGRPNAVILIKPDGLVIERGDKCRAASLTLVRHATDAELQEAFRQFSVVFGQHADAMAEEQWRWYQALGRPKRDKQAVVDGLTAALAARGLPWTLREFRHEAEAWEAWEARVAWEAREAWVARVAWEAWVARVAWVAREAREAREAWVAREARVAWVARVAWGALTVQFAARSGWITHKHDLLTVGIRDAYLNGLAVAIPTGPNELGWTMEKPL